MMTIGAHDTVTGGTGIRKCVLVYRHIEDVSIRSHESAHGESCERRAILGDIPIDIEFAIDREGIVHLLQVGELRPWGLGTQTSAMWSGDCPMLKLRGSSQRQGAKLAGHKSILASMPDGSGGNHRS